MKKLAIAVAILTALSAAAVVYSRTLATDDGGSTINHSQGQIIFPYSKVKAANAGAPKTIPFYTTTTTWPTTFVPTISGTFHDGGTACYKYDMVETPATGTPSGRTAGLPLYCVVNIPFESLDAGTLLVYKGTDGGYMVSQCPQTAAVPVPSTAWQALCSNQGGISP